MRHDPTNADYAFNLAVSLDRLGQAQAGRELLPARHRPRLGEPAVRPSRRPARGWRRCAAARAERHGRSRPRSRAPARCRSAGDRRRAPERRGPRKQLGEFLVEKGLINRDQLRVALTEQKQKNERLGKILVRLGLVSESVLRDVLAEMLRVESIDLSKVVPDHDAVALLPEELARRFRLLPISYDPNTRVLTVAMSDTFDVVGAGPGRGAARRQHRDPHAARQRRGDPGRHRDRLRPASSRSPRSCRRSTRRKPPADSPANAADEVTQPLVRLVDALLADAVKRRASDIHLEPEDGFIRVRYRIDGVLRQVSTVHKKFWGAIVVRLKVMSGMDITETRAPQDGRISLNIGGRSVDFRVAAQPTIHGENIVLRILDRRSGIVPLDDLGLPDDQLTLLKMLMARPGGRDPRHRARPAAARPRRCTRSSITATTSRSTS